MLAKSIAAFWALLLFISTVQAQFQFFEHMFGGGQQQEHHQQEQQDVASDSSWYQRTWDGGMLVLVSTIEPVANVYRSSVQPIAANTCALALLLACTFRTTVHVLIQMSKRRSSLVKEAPSASPRVASSLARQLGRSNWLGRDYYDTMLHCLDYMSSFQFFEVRFHIA